MMWARLLCQIGIMKRSQPAARAHDMSRAIAKIGPLLAQRGPSFVPGRDGTRPPRASELP
jgi:hypothetical protein